MVKILWSGLRVAGLSYLGLLTLLYFTQESLLFYPQTTPPEYQYTYDATEVYLTVDEATLHGLHFQTQNPSGLILYFHGNMGSLVDWGAICPDFVALGYECLIFNYRGYGKSSGTIASEAQWFADAEAIFHYAQNTSDAPLILYGRSVGSSMASYLAGKHSVDKVILESAPYRFTEVAQAHYWYLPVRWLIKYPFENAQYLKTNQNPSLLLHGTADEVVPFSQFEKLKRAFPQFEYSSFTGGRHNNLNQFPEYWETVTEFLKL